MTWRSRYTSAEQWRRKFGLKEGWTDNTIIVFLSHCRHHGADLFAGRLACCFDEVRWRRQGGNFHVPPRPTRSPAGHWSATRSMVIGTGGDRLTG